MGEEGLVASGIGRLKVVAGRRGGGLSYLWGRWVKGSCWWGSVGLVAHGIGGLKWLLVG